MQTFSFVWRQAFGRLELRLEVRLDLRLEVRGKIRVRMHQMLLHPLSRLRFTTCHVSTECGYKQIHRPMSVAPHWLGFTVLVIFTGSNLKHTVPERTATTCHNSFLHATVHGPHMRCKAQALLTGLGIRLIASQTGFTGRQ